MAEVHVTDEKEELRMEEWMITSLADTGLSVRAVNCLESREILTVADLSLKTNEDLLGIVNFGTQTLEQCKKLMRDIGVPHKLR